MGMTDLEWYTTDLDRLEDLAHELGGFTAWERKRGELVLSHAAPGGHAEITVRYDAREKIYFASLHSPTQQRVCRASSSRGFCRAVKGWMRRLAGR
jgi:hypothetical protein